MPRPVQCRTSQRCNSRELHQRSCALCRCNRQHLATSCDVCDRHPPPPPAGRRGGVTSVGDPLLPVQRPHNTCLPRHASDRRPTYHEGTSLAQSSLIMHSAQEPFLRATNSTSSLNTRRPSREAYESQWHNYENKQPHI